jgi:aminoglycoside phosphotransferase (APT) family kinase protein
MSIPLTELSWTASHIIDAVLARILIDQCCPNLHRIPHKFLGSGWDFEIWKCGRLAFRFPRRPSAVSIVNKEIKILPKLADILRIAIPKPTVLGQTTPLFPAPYWGHNYLYGAIACTIDLNSAQRGELAHQLGEFLRNLHTIRLNEAKLIGFEMDAGRGDLRHNQKRAKQSFAMIESVIDREWSNRLSSFVDSPPKDEAKVYCPIHGDFYSSHLVLRDNSCLAAVIDWGGMCLGDPALDLSIVYTFLPLEYHACFWKAYGDADMSTKRRARYLGVCRYGIRALAYSIVTKNRNLSRAAWIAIKNNIIFSE